MMSGELSLPPNVEGRLYGHLVMKIDEVLWARKPPGEVSAVVLWWGSEKPTSFRPSDVSECGAPRKNSGAVYEIHTTLELFKTYLKKCGSIKVAVADKFGMPIGCATVPDLNRMVHERPFENYYPIVNNFGNRIGDIHVSFNLRMSPISQQCLEKQTPNTVLNDVPKSIPLEKNVPSHAKRNTKEMRVTDNTKDEKMRRNKEVSVKNREGHQGKHCNIGQTVLEGKGKKSPTPQHLKKDINVTKESKNHKTIEATAVNEVLSKQHSLADNVITQILQHGKKLRDAMTASVIEDVMLLGVDGLVSSGDTPRSDTEYELMMNRLASLDELELKNYLHGMKSDGTHKQYHKTDKKKVVDYLTGKSMTEREEKDALEMLRCMTPSPDFMEDVKRATNCNPEKELAHIGSQSRKESREEVVVSVRDSARDSCESKATNDDTVVDVDSALLSRVNCLRVTVHSVTLNTVGLKRIGASNPRRVGVTRTGSIQPPPGVTYCIEYQSPQPELTQSKPWSAGVIRHCSKRQVGHEVLFGDRSTFNLPATHRASLSHQSMLASLIVSLTFKVCARHLNQRVPIMLGSAVPDSVMDLLTSAQLRHDYDLPVIAYDHLPVAQLRVCLELGRDRIHFGGLLDPGEPMKERQKENNSLGIASPSDGSSSIVKKPIKSRTPAGVKILPGHVTVTRNVSQKFSCGNTLWRDEQAAQQVAQTNRVVRNLVSNARKCVASSSSTPSQSNGSSVTARKNMTTGRPSPRFALSCVEPWRTKSSAEQSRITSEQFLKHELAITVEQINGCVPLNGSACQDRDCFVSYKFPSWDATKDIPVEWRSFSTEPSVSLKDTWFRKQSRVHSVLLQETIAFHSFLQHTFKQRAFDNNIAVAFNICERQYAPKIQDSLVAQAFLPLTTLVTLEETYCTAALNDPNFNESSCASVSFDLPLQLSPSFRHIGTIGSGKLRVKIDYRHLTVQSAELKKSGSYSGRSYENSKDNTKTDDQSHWNSVQRTNLVDDKHGLCHMQKNGVGFLLDVNRRSPVPNWARSPDSKTTPRLDSSVFASYSAWRNADNVSSVDVNKWNENHIQGTSGKAFSYPPCQTSAKEEQELHASWHPVLKTKTVLDRLRNQSDEVPFYRKYSRSVCSSRKHGSPHKSMLDLRPAQTIPCRDSSFDSCLSDGDLNLQTVKLSSASLSCEDLSLGRYDDFHSPINQDISINNNTTAFDVGVGGSEILGKQTDDVIDVVQCSTKNKLAECKSKATSTEEMTAVTTCTTVGSQTTERDLIDLTSDNHNSVSECGDAVNKNLSKGEADAVEVIQTDSAPVHNRAKETNKPHHIEGDVSAKSPNELPNNQQTESNILDTPKDTASEKMLSKCQSFFAKVGIECALHLWPTQSRGVSSECAKASLVFVTFHPCAESVIDKQSSTHSEISSYITPAVSNNGEPLWHWNCELRLPVELLFSSSRRLVFKVWQKELEDNQESPEKSDANHMIGFSAVDLTVLAAGLPLVCGWFNILDFSGICRGQIKLSIEPLEDISRLVEGAHSQQYQSTSQKTDSSPSPSSMYIAHCAYQEFPSHVAQFSDVRVQLIDSQLKEDALSAVLEGYQALLEHCQKLSDELPVVLKDSDKGSNSAALLTQGCSSPNAALNWKGENCKFNSIDSGGTTVLPFRMSGSSADSGDSENIPKDVTCVPSSTPRTLDVNDFGITNGVDKVIASEYVDHSSCLRERLSELDTLTKMMKERLSTALKLAHGSQKLFSAIPTTDENTETSTNNNVKPSGGAHWSGNDVNSTKSKTSFAETEAYNCQDMDERNETKGSRKSGGNSTDQMSGRNSSLRPAAQLVENISCVSMSRENGCDPWSNVSSSCSNDELHYSPVNVASPEEILTVHQTVSHGERNQIASKPRKVWEKPEELANLNMFRVDPQLDQDDSLQFDEVAEWLSDSVMQHVFNPALFHDLISTIPQGTAGFHGVRVIELDDTDSPQLTSCSSVENDTTHETWKNYDGENAAGSRQTLPIRGDMTFRKSSNEARSHTRQNQNNEMGGISTVDTDSGVDVDLSASCSSRAASSHPIWITTCPNRRDTVGSGLENAGSSPSSSVSVAPASACSPECCRQAPEGGNPTEHANRSQGQQHKVRSCAHHKSH